MNNMMAELYEKAQFGILPFSIDRTSLGWFLYAPQGKFPHPEEALRLLNQAYLAISQHLPCEIAFYVTPVVPLKELNGQASLLLLSLIHICKGQNHLARQIVAFQPGG